jgi:hypothetical protein
LTVRKGQETQNTPKRDPPQADVDVDIDADGCLRFSLRSAAPHQTDVS